MAQDMWKKVAVAEQEPEVRAKNFEEVCLGYTEEEAMDLIKKLLSYIPSNNREEAPRVECTDPIDRKEDLLNEIIPDDPNQAYDMYKVIQAVTDNGEFFEVQPKFAKNIITGFARFNGQSVGIVANQPSAYAGVLDTNASRKGARFVRFCDAFNIPIVSLVDVPGFLPGTGQEYNAVIDHGEKESGITIHYVNEHYDEGNIIFQAKTEVLPTDTADTLAEKIHQLEYQYFPEVISRFAD